MMRLGVVVALVLAAAVALVHAACPVCTDIWPPVPGDVPLHNAYHGDWGPWLSLQYTETIGFADFDGDGKDESVSHDGTCVVVQFRDEEDSEYSCGRINGAKVWYAPFFNGVFAGSPKYLKTLQFPDVDGDGQADVCGRWTDGIYCATAAGQLQSATRWLASMTDAQGWGAKDYYYETIRFPDVNGDGKADVCGRGSAGVYCAMSTGSSFIGFSKWTSSFGNADRWHTSPSYWSTLMFGDVNGDGADDLCGRGIAGYYCARADPLFRRFRQPTLFTSQFSDAYGWHTSESYYGTITLVDIHNDGYADVCGRGGSGIYCGVSDGNQFVRTTQLDAPQFSNANGWQTRNQYDTIAYADVDGDGQKDVCGRDASGIVCALSDPFVVYVFQGNAMFQPATLWVNNFSNAYGWSASERYWGTVQPAQVFLGTASWCGKGYGGIHCSNPPSVPVVAEIECSQATRSNGLGANNVAVIRWSWAGDPAPPSQATLRSMIWTGGASARAYFEDVSFGRMTLSGLEDADGDIFGAFVLDKGDPAFTDDQGNVVARQLHAHLAGLAGIVLGDYDAVMLWQGVGGRANAAYTIIDMYGTYGGSSVVLVHELMHAFGIDHDNLLLCRDNSGAQIRDLIPFTPAGLPNCISHGYANWFAIQGVARAFNHPTAYAKARLGWFNNDAIVTVPSSASAGWSATYQLQSMTVPGAGIKTVRVPLPLGTMQEPGWAGPGEQIQTYIYLEYRTPGPFETPSNANNGVLLYVGTEFYGSMMTLLLDANPKSVPNAYPTIPAGSYYNDYFGGYDADWQDAPLSPGATWTDAVTGIEITVNSITGGIADVTVQLT